MSEATEILGPVSEHPLVAVPPGRARRGRPSVPRTIALVVTGLYCLSSLLALVWAAYTSLKTDGDLFGRGPWALPSSWHFDNYLRAWTDADIGQYFFNSVYISVIAVVCSVFISAMAAYVIARADFRGSNLVLFYFIAAIMVPGFLYVIPLYSLLANHLHLGDNPLGLIVLDISGALPFDIFILTGFFKTLPAELEEAATIDGASINATYWRVVLPLAAPGLFTVAIFNFIGDWNEFFWALVLLSSQKFFTLPRGLYALYIASQYQAAWTVTFAGVIIATIPVLLVFALLQDRITEGLTVGALKG